MASTVENQICDAIDILINRNNETLRANYTVRGYIRGFNRETNTYYVDYQGQLLDMPTLNPGAAFQPGTEVFILLVNGDINEGKFIIAATDNINNPVNKGLVWNTSVD